MDRIGRYQILGELGRGAMGIVYRAQDPAIGRTVAIKTIRLSEFADNEERTKLRDRLFREAQSAGMLSHPGIVTIYDIAEEGDLAYVAMECVDGPTLDHLVAEEPPDGRLILSILAQTAAALDYAHKRGIVHRDIKPANIIVHGRTEAKVTDFGVAKIQSHQMTHAGSMIGTPNYMSPEQIQGKAVDGHSDQYSLAVIAYELLTGEKPFTAESLAALAFKIVNEDPAPVHRLNPTLGWTVDTVIRKGLAKNGADRYPTCSDFSFALENACRASKDWRPMAPGTAEDVATIIDVTTTARTTALARDSDATTTHSGSTASRRERSQPPAFLRVARILALIIAGAVLMGALLIGGLRFFAERREDTTAQNEPPPQSEEQPAKPSAMGDQVRPTLPGDSSAQPQQPATEEPKATPPKPAPAPPPEPVQTAEPRPEPPKPAEIQPKPVPAVRQPEATAIAVRLITNPPGAFVVVDGRSEYSCTSPCSLSLAPGRHTLAANKEGYRRTLKIFELPQDSENFLNLDRASGTIVVKSEPRGATIIIDGKQRAEKTPALLTLPTGRHTVELQINGRRETQEVTVRDSVITNVAVSFPER